MATVDMTVGGVANGAATSINHKARMGAQMPYTVEFTLDFAAATTAKGSALAAGDIFQVTGVNSLRKLRMIRTGGTSAVLNVTYYRQ